MEILALRSVINEMKNSLESSALEFGLMRKNHWIWRMSEIMKSEKQKQKQRKKWINCPQPGKPIPAPTYMCQKHQERRVKAKGKNSKYNGWKI